MSAQTENSKPKTGKFTAYFAVTAAIGTLLVAFAGTFVFLYVNMIRSEETSNLFKDKAGILARNVFGSPLLGVDIFSIIVSILLLAVILFVLFRRKEEKAAVKWIDYIEPVSSETVEEKDQFCNRTKLIVDTTERSEFLDGENRFRGVGGFRTWPGGVSFQGGFFTGDARPEHTDSDGDPSH